MSEPIFIVALLVVAGTVVTTVKLIATAIAGRGANRELAGMRDDIEQQAQALDQARGQLEQQSAQLAELQERVDFAERILAQQRERSQLPPGEAP